MGNGIIGKILYFWIFILGGLFIARILGFAEDGPKIIIFCIALALVYVVWNVARALGRKNAAEKQAQDVQPVRKGQSHKKKK